MKIKEGDKLPDAKVFVIDMNKEYEHKEISTSEILNKDKIILFGLPGAFTPGCSKKHLPSFLESTEKLKDKKYFIAEKILAKHDENYMPPEVSKALEKAKK